MKLNTTLMKATIAMGVLGMTGCVVHTRPRATVVATAPASGVVVYQAPPARRVVVNRPAAPYQGAIWVEGHWQWNGAQYVWVQGRYVRPRAGYVYVQPTWQRRGNGYVYVAGGWRQGRGRVRTTTVRTRGPAVRTTTVRTRGPAVRTTTVRTNRPGVRTRSR